MERHCEKCGTKLEDNSKFCPKCGTKVENEPKNKSSIEFNYRNIAIILLLFIIAALALAIVLSPNLFDSNIPLQSTDFGGVTMLAPKGSYFEEMLSAPPVRSIGGFVYLKNTGNYSKEVGMFGVSTGASVPDGVSHFKDDGDGVQIFKDDTLDDRYFLSKIDGDYYLYLAGSDYKAMSKMLKSANITDKTILKSKNSQQTNTPQTTSTTPAQSSTPTSLSILGGSFSTGSADEDKTYAHLNVGSQNAGKEIIVQIYYSRDGNTLNNGNMVPVTVHSDGYVELSSADAYKYYPDHADINIYDTNNHLLTSKSVSLSPTSGTQTF